VRIVVAGAGAVGGYIGARLAKAGADVVLFARGPHLEAMQTRGLRVTSAEGDFEVRPQVTGDLATIGTADVVFLGVKAHGLTALAPTLAPLLGPDTVVVSTQNGIPWWYFQNYGGELDGLPLEHVDPGGVIAASIEPEQFPDLGLTPRQLDVMRCLLRGMSTKLICRELKLQESTVKTHMRTIFETLNVHTRTQAILVASQRGVQISKRNIRSEGFE